MSKPIQVLTISQEEKNILRKIINQPKAEQRMSLRAWIILNRAKGLSQMQTAERCGVRRTVVSLWENRFKKDRINGLQDAKGRGRKSSIPKEKIERIITEVTQPPKSRTRWSVRSMARAVGVSKATVQRIWSKNDLKPHITKIFKISNDPEFLTKFWDIVGLYMNPPEKGLILCCDEKSQCQALERTQPCLPLKMGEIKTKTHDYKRHGTITLFAALNYLEGKIISSLKKRHTNTEWLRFLKQIDMETPSELSLHIVLDNYGTHKHANVRKWINSRNTQHQNAYQRDRIILHFTPTSSSWMNMVERFFRDITTDSIAEGSFGSVKELCDNINEYLAEHNLSPKRYVWKADGMKVLEKIKRAKEALLQVNNNS